MEKATPTEHVGSATQSVEAGSIDLPSGWMYKRPRLGPLRFSWYASPESQIVLVAFVCFLCPGRSTDPAHTRKGPH